MQPLAVVVAEYGMKVELVKMAHYLSWPGLRDKMQQLVYFVELALWGVLLNIRAVKNLFVSSKFSASLFYQLKFSQAREIDK